MNGSSDLNPLKDPHSISKKVEDVMEEHHKGKKGDSECVKPV